MLVVEDDERQRESIQQLLSADDVEITGVGHGGGGAGAACRPRRSIAW